LKKLVRMRWKSKRGLPGGLTEKMNHALFDSTPPPAFCRNPVGKSPKSVYEGVAMKKTNQKVTDKESAPPVRIINDEKKRDTRRRRSNSKKKEIAMQEGESGDAESQ